MNMNPAMLMFRVWALFMVLYALLPFQLLGKTLSVYGFGVLGLFLLVFWFGVALAPREKRNEAREWARIPDFSRADRILHLASAVAVVSLLVDLQGRDVLDLADAYSRRSDQGAALLAGEHSSSSLAFQVGFLFYPAGYVYIVRNIVFERDSSLTKLFLFGLLPVLLATLAMGGRSPFLYCLVAAFLASSAKKLLRREAPGAGRKPRSRFTTFAFLGLSMAALYYFIAVFHARAATVGGTLAMFDVAETLWGVGFHGPLSEAWFHVLGDEVMYLIFVFTWYIVQGLVMGNILFTDYDGPLQLGIYGIDLASALARRINGSLVASSFDSLMQLGTYGFFPSAFGSLYVDFWFYGLIVSGAWGFFAGVVYQKIRGRGDARWLLCGPFVTMGTLFSFNNTPLGFSNGLVTHLWLLVAFLMAAPQKPGSTVG